MTERRLQTGSGFTGPHTAKPKLKLPVVLKGITNVANADTSNVIASLEDGAVVFSGVDGKLILSLQEDEVREWLGITLPQPVYR